MAFVGAVIGAVATLLDSWRRTRHDQVGAAKALYFEMETNAFYLSMMAELSPLTDLTHQTWDATQSRVANLLAPGDFRVVALAYGELALCQSNIDAARSRADSVSDAERKIWFHGYNRFIAAMAVVRRVWAAEDQPVIAKATEDRMSRVE